MQNDKEETERDFTFHWFIVRVGPGCSLELGNASRFLLGVTGAHALWPSSVTLPGAFSGS